MAVTVESFLAANRYFDGRNSEVVQAALDEAALHFDSNVCGELTDRLIEAKARCILLGDPTGMPTSATRENRLRDDAEDRLRKLMRLVPIRSLGTRCG